MRENYTLSRLYLEADLSGGAELTLSKEQAHYLGTVLRKSAGDALRIFNGRDGEWKAELIEVSKRAASLRVGEQLRPPQKCPDITLAFAPVRKHRTAFIVEKATELGAARLQPLQTARTQFPRFNIDKARLQAIEAAEQTERLDIPEILPMLRGGLNDYIGGWNFAGPLIFADESGDCPPAAQVLKDLKGPTTLLIGPEGGFTGEERNLLRAQDFVRPVSLGPRILRADTAALSLLTLWQALCGDWA